MRIDAILFDKDGTLFDFAGTWEVWTRAILIRLSGKDQTRAQMLGKQIGFDFATRRFVPGSIVVAGTNAEIVDLLLPHCGGFSHQSLLDLLNEEAAQVPQSQVVPLAPLLDMLRGQGLGLGVATDDSEAPARAHLGAAGILDRFDFVAGFDSGYGAKPGPGQMLAFAGHIGAAPDRVVMVGDSTHDLTAGRAAGMLTIGVLTGVALTHELEPHADFMLPDIGHLPEWLRG